MLAEAELRGPMAHAAPFERLDHCPATVGDLRAIVSYNIGPQAFLTQASAQRDGRAHSLAALLMETQRLQMP